MHRSSFDTKDVYAVILVGGKGKRLKPLSTEARPKAFLSITKDRKTMFRRTAERIGMAVPSDNIIVVANKKHIRLIKKDLPRISKCNIILEPLSRNTAPAITLSALALKDRSPDAVMVVLSSDHYITGIDTFLDSIKCGVRFVRDNANAIVVFGINPTYPATVFGYIKLKNDKTSRPAVRSVERFVEKPDLGLAKRYVKSGNYLWNSGMFVFRPDTILNSMREYAPEIFYGIKDGKSYKNIPDLSIDYAVMEKAYNVYCVKSSYGWHDVGGFESLRKVLRLEGRRFVEKNGKVTNII